jgi:ubiquitin carboxyl-terminal hydrolase 5/13
MDNGGDVSSLISESLPQLQEMVEESKLYTKYELHAVIVHLGKSVHSGHYIAYVKKQGKWILYNDSKVYET